MGWFSDDKPKVKRNFWGEKIEEEEPEQKYNFWGEKVNPDGKPKKDQGPEEEQQKKSFWDF